MGPGIGPRRGVAKHSMSAHGAVQDEVAYIFPDHSGLVNLQLKAPLLLWTQAAGGAGRR